MDQQKVAVMRQNYAAMNDDELIWIAATRMATLTDEARAALQDVIRLRKLGDADAAVAEVRHELQQHAAALREAESKREVQRQMRSWMRWGVLVGFILGGIVTVMDDDLERGLWIAGTPLLFYLWHEAKRLGWTLIWALFR